MLLAFFIYIDEHETSYFVIKPYDFLNIYSALFQREYPEAMFKYFKKFVINDSTYNLYLGLY